MAEACLLCAASNRSSWCTLPPTIGDAAGDQFSIVFGVSLPTADDPIAVDGIELAEVAPPARLVGGDHGRSAPAEEVDDDTAALGHILERPTMASIPRSWSRGPGVTHRPSSRRTLIAARAGSLPPS